MELVLLCLSLLVQHGLGLAQEPCKCLDQRLCRDHAGCGYRCRAGFTGKYCSQINLGFKISLDAPEIFDGDFSTCSNDRKGSKIRFKHSIDIDKIRIHRKNNGTGGFYAFVYKSGQSVRTWELYQNEKSVEGVAAAILFPLQTGVTAIEIHNMYPACEVELTHEQALPQPTPTPSPARVCKQDTCYRHGNCENVGNTAVCHCKPGYTGEKCENRCPSGTYGHNCSSSCSRGCKYKRCDRETGRCTQRDCEAGWTNSDINDRCDKKQCSTGCTGDCDSNGRCDTCKPGWTHSDAYNPLCDKKCAPGHYGAGCQQTCSSGCSGFTCIHVTGRCSCKDGWTGVKCNQCTDGYSGTNCRKCSEGCADICNKANGACNCKAGWTGTDCSRECSAGWYGPNCKTRCNEGCQTEHCNHVTGHCNSRCRDGWTGGRCKKTCAPGKYGANCALNCSRGCSNGTCDPVSGVCAECIEGWELDPTNTTRCILGLAKKRLSGVFNKDHYPLSLSLYLLVPVPVIFILTSVWVYRH